MAPSVATQISFETFSNVIDGSLRSSKHKYQGIDPNTSRPNWDVPVASLKDVDNAVDAANRAYKEWRTTSWEYRRERINLFKETVQAYEEDLVEILIKETGKPRRVAKVEVSGVYAHFDWHIKLEQPKGEEFDLPTRHIRHVYEPLGVAVAICPWNFPLKLSLAKLLPAVQMGNAVIIKPSPFTPYTALKIAEIANLIFPPGLVQALGGDNRLGPALVEHPGVHKISFTGSTAVGKSIMAAAAKTLKRVTLELGGNDPAIVLPDADIAQAAQLIAMGAFYNTGQVCVATKRIYVHSSVYDVFLTAFTNAVKSLKVGNANDEGVMLGPVQNQKQFDRIKDFFHDTKDKGYRLALGTVDCEDSIGGLFINPTIIDDPPDQSMIVQEEQFGPIVPIQRYQSVDEAIGRANSTTAGLGATVFGTNSKLLQEVAEKLDSGNVWINSSPTVTPEAQFGGVKESGIGTEFGSLGILARRLKALPTLLPLVLPVPSESSVAVESNQPQDGIAPYNGSQPQGNTGNASPEHGASAEYSPNTHSPQSEDSSAREIELPWSPGGAEHRQSHSYTARSLSPVYAPSTVRSSVQDLPDYIKPMPSHLDADDIAYLEKKDAFTLPHPALRDDCLRCYYQFMHPLYPTVEFDKIWSTVHAPHGSTDNISLLLLQAVIFAGGMWTDVRLVRKAGFLSRKAFRQSLDRRIRVLYDADYEDDRLTLVQSLLLWSFWFRKANDQKDGWYWVGVAHSIACSMDLQYSPPTDATDAINQQMQRLRKKVWWSLCNREIIAAFDLRRAPRFTIAVEDISTITPDDFTHPEAGSVTGSGMNWPPDAPSHLLACLSVEYIKLNQILGKILSITCHRRTGNKIFGAHLTQAARNSNTMPWNERQKVIDDLIACNQELATWRKQVPIDLWHSGPLPDDPSEWSVATASHRAILCMMYNMAVMTIHRPQALPLETYQPNHTGVTERDRKHLARSRVRHAAQEITKVAMDFFNADLLNFLPATVVSCIMPVSIHHSFDTFSDDNTIRNQASRQLDECKAMLYTLAERQFAPSWVLKTIEYILSRARRRERSSQDGSKSGDRRMDDTSNTRSAPGQTTGPRNTSNTYLDQRAAFNAQGASSLPPLFGGDGNPASERPDHASRAMELTSMTGMVLPGETQTEGVGHFNDISLQDARSAIPSSSVMDFPLLSDAGGFGALEDSWFDLAGIPDSVTGSNWPLGSF
ncbi:uncharacterized protein Z519_09315 [Cladophialophora bantiana CBS 173.52]|uniref:aldehyde dehydrogenase (NAD(+)) n=1 Tax=Cladophialophora bantiana (strain ATCC 10958 / CBS 173.52 / CDC B-1940 / NIH 8579) TaxID=1442370 RepID=A0A0D2EIJ4_CLAB1|nr:uncharacterized protein Z519_09315 [Cladophialophora bantiana CBS 173.52]KIW89886.1 hypothetical protein Z519_09315 [Cladophialophora bantiana CBS 173.52]